MEGWLRYWRCDDTRFVVSTACAWEATARKIGNVHPGRSFADVTHLDFVVSGCAVASALEMRLPVGRRVRHAVERSKHVTGSNTNLGIALLLAPLAAVAGWHVLSIPEEIAFDFRKDLPPVLQGLTVKDAEDVYEAIRLAAPGGLGDARKQDVKNEPTVTLLKAMEMAADRDMIARQYANSFADVLDFGVPAFTSALAEFGSIEAAIIDCQLRWLAEFPDSLIVRKNGLPVAEDVRRWAGGVLKAGGLATPEGRAAGVALDQYLRSDGNRLNPGTTADLVTACLFVALREDKVTLSAPFRWQVEDWL
jgi:triphosphoribosyl-dephospho-CoA synthase